MITKIICPVDFMPASLNAATYAAAFSRMLNTRLHLVHIQQFLPVSSPMSMGVEIYPYMEEVKKGMEQKLKALADELGKAHQIPVNYSVEDTTGTMEAALAKEDLSHALITMGTNGADDMYQRFFGSDTYHAIKEVDCALLMVPEKVVYSPVKKVLFAWDYSKESEFSFSSLNDLLQKFDPDYEFVHVSKTDTEIGEDVFRALKGEITDALQAKNKVKFKHVYSGDIPATLHEAMLQSDAGLFCMTYHKRGIIANFFHGEVARKISEMASYPVLVLHT